MDPDEDHPEFDNHSRWPRRLLHVRSMTSFKWEPGNTYGGRTEPEYVALSYTWGRYMLQDGERTDIKPLPIRDVPWAIPRVNPSTHFSTREFQHVIHEVVKTPDRFYAFDNWQRDTRPRIRDQTLWGRFCRSIFVYIEKTRPVFEFLWLDIACIDQRWTPITMAEVGRQARIFRHAKHSYAWLSHLPHEALQDSLTGLADAVTGLQSEPFDQGSSYSFEAQAPMQSALNAVTALVADPWFSSLWTLQEAFLCNRAMILSREGELTCEATLTFPRAWSLDYLFNLANSIVLWSERTRVDKQDALYQQLLEMLHRTGLSALWYNTPMALLGVSYHRNTTRELDRVYGIMQVFGSDFRVGLARDDVDPNYVYDLAELEDEMGAAVIERYPVLSQMHIYLEQPGFSRGWCVRGNSTIPMIAERGDMFGWKGGDRIEVNIDIDCKNLCQFSTRQLGGNTWAYLSGKACRFALLQDAWRKVDDSEYAKAMLKSGWRMHRCSIPSVHMIALDKGTEFEPQISMLNVLNVINIKDVNYQHQLAQNIVESPNGQNLDVLLLGRCDFGNESFYVGMMVLGKHEDGVYFWRRIGICIWLTSHLSKDGVDHPLKQLLEGETEQWRPIQGLFG